MLKYLIILFLFISLDLYSQSELQYKFDDYVELNILNNEGIYNKNQAIIIYNDFIKKNKIISFNKIHKGNNNNSYFIIYELITDKTNYRVCIYYVNDKIQKITIY